VQNSNYPRDNIKSKGYQKLFLFILLFFLFFFFCIIFLKIIYLFIYLFWASTLLSFFEFENPTPFSSLAKFESNNPKFETYLQHVWIVSFLRMFNLGLFNRFWLSIVHFLGKSHIIYVQHILSCRQVYGLGLDFGLLWYIYIFFSQLIQCKKKLRNFIILQ
jgi:hypothetical protein